MRQRSYSGRGVASASSFVTRFDSPIRSVDPNRTASASPERRGTDGRPHNDGSYSYNDDNYDEDDDDDGGAASPTVDEIERMLERLNLPQLRDDPTGSGTYRGGGAGGGTGNNQRDLSPKQKAAAAFNVTATSGAESAAASLRITGASSNLGKDNVDRHGHGLLDTIPHVRSRAASVATTSAIPLAHEDERRNAGRHNDDDDDDTSNNAVTPHQRIQRRPRTPPAADADNDGAEESQGLQRSVSFAPTKVGGGAPRRTGEEGLQRAKSSAILRRTKSASGGGLARKSDSRLDATLSTEPSLPPPTVDAEAELRRSERVMIAMDFGVKADVGAAVRPGTAEMSQGMGAALGVASAAVSFEAARAMSRLKKATEPPEPVVALNIEMGADPRDGTVSHRRLLVYPNENPRDVAFRFILENSLDHDRALEPLTAYLQRAIDKKRARVAQAELEERLAAVANAGGGGDPFEHSGTDSDGSDPGGTMDPTSFRHRRRSATPAAFGRGVTFLRGTGGFTEAPPRGGEAKPPPPPPAGHRPSRMEEQQMQSLRRRSHSFAGQSFVSTHTTTGARHASPGLSRLMSMHKKGVGGAPSGGSLQTKQTTSSDSADKSAVATEESNAGGDVAQTSTSAGAMTAAKRREQLAARMKKQKEEDRTLRGLTTEEREVRRMCTFKPSRQRTLSPPPQQQHTTPAARSKTPPKAASRRTSLDDAGAVKPLPQQQRSRTPPVGTAAGNDLAPKAIQQRQQRQAAAAAAAAALTPAQRVKAMFQLSTADAAAVSRALPGVVPTLSAEEKAALRKKAGGRYRHASSSPRRAPAIPLAGSDMAAIATAAARTAAIDRLSQPRAITPKKVFAKPVTTTTAKATTRARTPR